MNTAQISSDSTHQIVILPEDAIGVLVMLLARCHRRFRVAIVGEPDMVNERPPVL
jgi:hypothetical protein